MHLTEITGSKASPHDQEHVVVRANRLSGFVGVQQQLSQWGCLNILKNLRRIPTKFLGFIVVDWIRRTDDIYDTGGEPNLL